MDPTILCLKRELIPPGKTHRDLVQPFFDAIEGKPDIAYLDPRRIFNVLAPVSRLPVELLAMVFEIVDNDRFLGPSPCISLSHVCHHWRQVAINQKALWTAIPTSSPSWARAFISRSSPKPIDIDPIYSYDPRKRAHYQSMRVILEELPRLAGLRLTEIAYKKDEYWTLFLPDAIRLLTQSPAPSLRSLEICEMSKFIDSTQIEASIDLPDDLLAGQVPERLRSLALFLCRFIPAISLLRAPLTDIRLSYCCVGSHLDDIVDALSSLPSLENLYLASVVSQYPPPAFSHFPPRNKITLPNIRSLELWEETRHVIGLMQRLSFPRSARLTLQCNGDGIEDAIEMEEDFVQLIRLLFSPALASGVAIRNTTIWLCPSQWFSLSTDNPPSLAPISAHPPKKLDTFQELEERKLDLHPKLSDGERPVEPLDSALASELFQQYLHVSLDRREDSDFDIQPLPLLSLLPEAMELSLNIGHEVTVYYDEWLQRGVGEWRYLESVAVASHTAVDFILALDIASSPSDPEHTDTPFLPFLTQVTLSFLDFVHSRSEDGRTLLEDLIGALEKRRVDVGELAYLKIEYSDVAEDMAERLQEVVKEVKVIPRAKLKPTQEQGEDSQVIDA